MKGECLCAGVRFEIDGVLPNLYQCHCALCRQATGSVANAATFVLKENFHWVSGRHTISSYQKPSGYRNDFCSVCGSPAPNELRETDLVWIPAGLIKDEIDSRITAHLYLSYAASWEQESDDCVRLDSGPDSLRSLTELL